MRTGDTIAAISTPPGTGGLGVVRLSGVGARAVAERMLRFGADHEWRAWTASLAELTGSGGVVVDQVVVTYFAAPRSYTGEEVVEISCHGSMVVLAHCVDRAMEFGARAAGPGEFTLRAFLNGRISLPEAEAVHDLITATTLYQAKIAAQQMGGSLSRAVAPLKSQLLELIALLEAGIDFAEDDISVAAEEEILARLRPIKLLAAKLVASYNYGRLVHDGVTLAIAGRPNVGKSSLFNQLLEQDRAIVTETAGTTRDTISERASIGGIPVKLVDTAGIRETEAEIERLGIERSMRAMADSDVTLVVLDRSVPLTDEDEAIIARAASAGRSVVVANKCDLGAAFEPAPDAVSVSAKTGAGIGELRGRIVSVIAPNGAIAPESGLITSVRHERLLKECVEALEHAEGAVIAGLPHELLLIDCYAALSPIDALTGATTADDILNRIFSSFCIGK